MMQRLELAAEATFLASPITLAARPLGWLAPTGSILTDKQWLSRVHPLGHRQVSALARWVNDVELCFDF
jgi:hypothetical protein